MRTCMTIADIHIVHIVQKLLQCVVLFILIADWNLVHNVSGQSTALSPHIQCYYTSWSVYRGDWAFRPGFVDPSLCSVIVFAYVQIKDSELAVVEDRDMDTIRRLSRFKKQNENLQVHVSVGGWTLAHQFAPMAGKNETRAKFVKSTIDFLRNTSADGINIDWEYPETPEERVIMSALLEDLRVAFEKEAVKSNKTRLVLSVFLGAKVRNGHDVEVINRTCDIVNVLGYDFSGDWDIRTGHNSPLFARRSQTGESATANVKFLLESLVQQGFSRSKLNIGIPTFGRSWLLENSQQHGFDSPTKGPGWAGPFTNKNGTLALYEICGMLKRMELQTVLNDDCKCSYAFNSEMWVSYDEPRSAAFKSAWVKRNGYGGVYIWELGMDDFKGTECIERKKFPILRAVRQAYDSERSTLPDTLTQVDQSTRSTTRLDVAVGVPVGLVLGGIIVAGALACCHRRRLKGKETIKMKPIISLRNGRLSQGEVELSPLVHALEIPRSSINFVEAAMLGRGNFGEVFLAEVQGLGGITDGTMVAVKRLKNGTDDTKKMFLEEIKLMAEMGRHTNITNLLGVTMIGETWLILEYCELGSLDMYLRSLKRQQRELEAEQLAAAHSGVKLAQLVEFAYQIARGMVYLSFKHIVHRDLAARNVLITKDLLLKISDFGLAIKIEGDHRDPAVMSNKMPVKWMSPESMKEGVFNEKTDVWSYGVTVWEIYTLGDSPYNDIAETESLRDFIKLMSSGYRMTAPETMPAFVKSVMESCWEAEPQRRPTFTEIRRQLQESCREDYYLSFDISYEEYNKAIEESLLREPIQEATSTQL